MRLGLLFAGRIFYWLVLLTFRRDQELASAGKGQLRTFSLLPSSPR